MQEYEDHQLASVLPLMGKRELKELAADIMARGQVLPITLLDGRILDGRNRYRACKLIGAEPVVQDFKGKGDPVDFIVSLNIKHRHLTKSQRAIAAARLANLPRGDISRFSEESSQTAPVRNGKTASQAAKQFDVATRTVEEAKEVLRDAPKEDVKAIEAGKKTVGQVAREVKEAKAKKQETLDKTGYPIPESILEDWKRAESFNNYLRDLSRIKTAVADGLEDDDVIFREINNSAVSILKHAYGELKCIIPYSVCTSCQGHERQKCTLCKQRGFISQFAYNQFVPAETKAIRSKVAAQK